MMMKLLEWIESEKYDILLIHTRTSSALAVDIFNINLFGFFFSIMKKQRLQRKLKLMKEESGRNSRNKMF